MELRVKSLMLGRLGLVLLVAMLASSAGAKREVGWRAICQRADNTSQPTAANASKPTTFESAKTLGDLYSLVEFRAGRTVACDKLARMTRVQKLKFGLPDNLCWLVMDLICLSNPVDKRVMDRA